MNQQIQYCTTPDGVRMAYALTGEGTPVVRTSHWFAHLDDDLERPVYRHLLLDIVRCHRLLRSASGCRSVTTSAPYRLRHLSLTLAR